ncbi:MAG: hypothetical protein HY078_16685 [Elusimicrobia bacterium]|nr:hypothetical protein [Elusimicrobiota bacterium]
MKTERIFPWLFAACLAAVVFEVLLNFEQTWVHPEVWTRMSPAALKSGAGLHWTDLRTALDYTNFDLQPRFRVLSSLFFIANAKLRAVLFDRIVPIPGFSIAWPFTVLLSPLLLYGILFNLTRRAATAWTGAVLYLVSPGALSGAAMLFHPGKPMGNVSILLCLYVGSALEAHSREGRSQSRGLFAALCALIFANYFWDEQAWFAAAAVPVLCPSVFLPWRERRFEIAAYASATAAFLAVLILAAPAITRAFGVSEFSVWLYMLDRRVSVDAARLTINGVVTGASLVGDHLLPFLREHWLYPGALAPAALLVGGYFWSSLKASSEADRSLAARLAVLAIGYIVFQTALLVRHMSALSHCYYYGIPFSIFAAMLLAACLQSGSGWRKNANAGLLAYFLAVFFWNFNTVNRGMRRDHAVMWTELGPPGERTLIEGRLTRAGVAHVWNARRDAAELDRRAATLPTSAFWLPLELKAIDRVRAAR